MKKSIGRRFTLLDVYYLVSIRKLPLPLRERGGVRGIKMKSIEILSHYHPPPCPSPIRGEGKTWVSGWTLSNRINPDYPDKRKSK